MPPLYSGSADEWSYISNDTSNLVAKTVDFIIDNFEKEMEKGQHKLKSNTFTVKHTHWHIKVDIPGKAAEDGETYIGVYLRNDNNLNFSVEFKAVIGDTVKSFAYEVEANNGYGWSKFLTKEACKKVLIDSKLQVHVEMKLIQEEKTEISAAKSNIKDETSILDSKIFDMMSFSDFKVICNGNVFPCHKAFLAARSIVFRNMLEAEMKEANDGSVEIINHTEIVVDNFVKFFYINQVDDEVLKNHAISFLDLGEQYQMEGLKRMTELTMIAYLSTENMLRYFIAGARYQSEEIKEAAKAFIRKNRRSLVKQEGWRDAVTDRDLLLDLIESLAMD